MGMIEETDKLMLDWNKISGMDRENKVIPVAVQNSITKEVILIAYTNEEAFAETVRRKKLVLWSTSRNKLWFKGAESGNTFTVVNIFVNCEQNSLVYHVLPDKGNICHTSFKGVPNNCYYRQLDTDRMKLINLSKLKDICERLKIVSVGGFSELICPIENANLFITEMDKMNIQIKEFSWWCHVTDNHKPCGMGGPKNEFGEGWFSETMESISFKSNEDYHNFFLHEWRKSSEYKPCYQPGFWIL